jgi:hypothetical protein
MRWRSRCARSSKFVLPVPRQRLERLARWSRARTLLKSVAFAKSSGMIEGDNQRAVVFDETGG